MASDKRYQVFVSSTYVDLRLERQAVIAALLECDAFPAGMELFPAADDDAWTLIRRVIDDSDYYLLVIGGKYGSVDPIERISYTEKEFDYAVSTGKPVMAFLHSDPGKIPAELTERSDEMQEKLEAFRQKVEGSKHVKYWSNPDALAGAVALSFNRFVRSYAAVGWVRASALANAEVLQELAKSRAVIDGLQEKLGAARTEPPPGTSGLAQGDEKFTLPFRIKGRFTGANGSRRVAGSWVFAEVTWDDVLGAIGPNLLQESTETVLRGRLEDYLSTRFYDEAAQAIATRAKELAPGLPANHAYTVALDSASLDDEDFGTVLVQLMALGLIAQSQKKRSVSDTGTYWTLTEYGQTRVVQLRALRSTQTDLRGASPAEREREADGEPGRD